MAVDPEEHWDFVDGIRLFSRVLEPREAAGLQPAPAVVFVHALGMSSRYMEPLLRQLSARHRVHAPDLPGIGRSDAPARLLGPAERARVLLRWLNAIGLDQPSLLRHSAGCEVARLVAEQDPGRISCLIPVSPAPDPGRRRIWSQFAGLLLDAFRETPPLLLLAIRDYLDAGAPADAAHPLDRAAAQPPASPHHPCRRGRAVPYWAADTGDSRRARSGGVGTVGPHRQPAGLKTGRCSLCWVPRTQ
jgi:pimeloyl-ACP methyl ester carboxylesterase